VKLPRRAASCLGAPCMHACLDYCVELLRCMKMRLHSTCLVGTVRYGRTNMYRTSAYLVRWARLGRTDAAAVVGSDAATPCD
jgi:hypothetical protein